MASFTEDTESYQLTRSSSFSLSNDLSMMMLLPSDIPPQSTISDEEARYRIAERFLVKKSRRFGGPANTVFTDQSSNNRIKGLVSRMKDSVKSTISSSLPKTKTITRMTNTLVSTIKSQRLPECLRYLGLADHSNTASHGVKRKKGTETNVPRKRANLQGEGEIAVCESSEMEISERMDFKFAKPKTYECGYCNSNYYHVPSFLKHIRKHKKILRCEGCNKSFNHLVSKRRHQLRCYKRAFL